MDYRLEEEVYKRAIDLVTFRCTEIAHLWHYRKSSEFPLVYLAEQDEKDQWVTQLVSWKEIQHKFSPSYTWTCPSTDPCTVPVLVVFHFGITTRLVELTISFPIPFPPR